QVLFLYFQGRVPTSLQVAHALRADVESQGRKPATKRHGQGQAYISEADDRDAGRVGERNAHAAPLLAGAVNHRVAEWKFRAITHACMNGLRLYGEGAGGSCRCVPVPTRQS